MKSFVAGSLLALCAIGAQADARKVKLRYICESFKGLNGVPKPGAPMITVSQNAEVRGSATVTTDVSLELRYPGLPGRYKSVPLNLTNQDADVGVWESSGYSLSLSKEGMIVAQLTEKATHHKAICNMEFRPL